MKSILIIVGHSGAGKSTLAKEYILCKEYPLLTFRDVGKELAIKNGFSSLGTYFNSTNTMVFKKDLGEELLKKIYDKMLKTDVLIIEGLVFWDVVLSIKNIYKNVLVVNIDTPYEIRIERIAQKLRVTLQEAYENEKSKAKLKFALGIDDVLNRADFTLDGRKPVKMLVEELGQFIDYNFCSNI